jgi:hypothetical protein
LKTHFSIKGRGLVPVPYIVPEGDERFRVGDPITLKRPDGLHLEWTIESTEIRRGTLPDQNDLVIVLRGLDQDDLPVGSEFWSADT